MIETPNEFEVRGFLHCEPVLQSFDVTKNTKTLQV